MAQERADLDAERLCYERLFFGLTQAQLCGAKDASKLRYRRQAYAPSGGCFETVSAAGVDIGHMRFGRCETKFLTRSKYCESFTATFDKHVKAAEELGSPYR